MSTEVPRRLDWGDVSLYPTVMVQRRIGTPSQLPSASSIPLSFTDLMRHGARSFIRDRYVELESRAVTVTGKFQCYPHPKWEQDHLKPTFDAFSGRGRQMEPPVKQISLGAKAFTLSNGVLQIDHAFLCVCKASGTVGPLDITTTLNNNSLLFCSTFQPNTSKHNP